MEYQLFDYNALYHLTDAQATGGTGGTYGPESYAYNANTGNLESKVGEVLSYDDANHPHARQPTTAGRTGTMPMGT